MPFSFNQKHLHLLRDVLIEKKLKIVLAESMTGGFAANQFSSLKKASDFFLGSLVTYNADLKSRLLRIPADLIEKHSAESKIVTVTMAKNLSRQIKADIAVAITGLDSPGGSESKEKPVGTVFIAVYYQHKNHFLKKQFRGQPQMIRKKATDEMVKFVLKIIR